MLLQSVRRGRGPCHLSKNLPLRRWLLRSQRAHCRKATRPKPCMNLDDGPKAKLPPVKTLLALPNYCGGMSEPTQHRSPLTLFIAIMAMVLVLLAPAHATVNSLVVEHPLHQRLNASTATSISVIGHASHHGAVHDHVHDILASRPITMAASSVPPNAWQASGRQGFPLSLDLTPDQPPRA